MKFYTDKQKLQRNSINEYREIQKTQNKGNDSSFIFIKTKICDSSKHFLFRALSVRWTVDYVLKQGLLLALRQEPPPLPQVSRFLEQTLRFPPVVVIEHNDADILLGRDNRPGRVVPGRPQEGVWIYNLAVPFVSEQHSTRVFRDNLKRQSL